MKQITPEIKEKIFALYFGQRVAKCEPEDVLLEVVGDIYDIPHLVRMEWFIELKSLSTITNEDAIGVAKIMYGPDGDFDIEFNSSGLTSVSPFGLPCYTDTINICWDGNISYERAKSLQVIEATDYLRSKGYALPAFGYSVDELVEAGVFKLKGDKQ